MDQPVPVLEDEELVPDREAQRESEREGLPTPPGAKRADEFVAEGESETEVRKRADEAALAERPARPPVADQRCGDSEDQQRRDRCLAESPASGAS